MRIGLYLASLALGQSGGVETYGRGLVKGLQCVDNDNDYRLIVSSRNEGAFPIFSRSFKKRVIPITLNRALNAMNLLRLPLRRTLTAGVYRGLELASGLDIIHYPFQVFPHYMTQKVPTVLTVVDIQEEYFPEYFTKRDLLYRRNSFRPSAEAATRIIAISRFTKDCLMDRYAIPGEKISVVPLGYDDDASRIDSPAMEAVKRKYSLPEKFFFYPAATWKHKNHISLLRAVRILRDRYGFQAHVVLTGMPAGNHRSVMDEAARLGLSDTVLFLGYVPYEVTTALFYLSFALVFPSLFEGFGLPVVEAMAAGLPVACSYATSLPEVAGDAALFFNPKEPEDIARQLFLLLENEELRSDLVARGRLRAELFTWRKTAIETMQIYKEILA